MVIPLFDPQLIVAVQQPEGFVASVFITAGAVDHQKAYFLGSRFKRNIHIGAVSVRMLRKKRKSITRPGYRFRGYLIPQP
ncbi:hypothetical protein D3C75_1155380 [compost metagenome]